MSTLHFNNVKGVCVVRVVVASTMSTLHFNNVNTSLQQCQHLAALKTSKHSRTQLEALHGQMWDRDAWCELQIITTSLSEHPDHLNP
jgi:hypothetical protein